MIQQQRGLVALTATIIMSLLFVITLLGVTTVMLSEKRQSTDADQSIRAYYAAEAGAERAMRRIRHQLKTAGTVVPVTSCNPTQSASDQVGGAGSNEFVTCTKVTTRNPNLLYDLKRDAHAYEIDMGPTLPMYPDYITIEWNKPSEPATNFTPFTTFNRTPTTPPWTRPAVLEIQDFSYNTGGGGPNAGSARYTQNVLVPSTSGAAQYKSLYHTENDTGDQPFHGDCSAARPEYRCVIKLDLQGGGGHTHVIRLRARYADASIRIRAYKNGQVNPLAMPDSYARIDVTARAGTVFRRLVQYVPIDKGIARGLDYVIYSETDICKNISVSGGIITDVCNPTLPPPPPPGGGGGGVDPICTTGNLILEEEDYTLGWIDDGDLTWEQKEYVLPTPMNNCFTHIYARSTEPNHEPGVNSDQTNERVFYEGYSQDGTLTFRSGLTKDIPEEETVSEPIDEPIQRFSNKATHRLLVKHISIHPDPSMAGLGRQNINSIHGGEIRLYRPLP